MPKLTISSITNAMYGGTPLSAVYKGSTPIWTPPAYYVTVTDTYYVKTSSGSCTRGTRYDMQFEGIHNVDHPDREVAFQYFNPSTLKWVPEDLSGRWQKDSVYPNTQPNVNFSFRCYYIYKCSSTPNPAREQGRMRIRLPDGTEFWGESRPAFYDSSEEPEETFIEPLEESELEDG